LPVQSNSLYGDGMRSAWFLRHMCIEATVAIANAEHAPQSCWEKVVL